MANDYLIFGIQGSGTQFVDTLMRLNFDKDAQYDSTMPGNISRVCSRLMVRFLSR